MLDTNHCVCLSPSPSECSPVAEEPDKAALKMDLDRNVYHSLKEVLQLKLQQRRTREELVSQGIMPPLKSPAAFHEQRRSLERARTEDYLKRKIRSRPERSELVRMHILEETSAEPSLQAKQLQLKRARLADDLNDKISHRPGPIELVHKNILSVDCPSHDHLLDSPKEGGESSSLDEDSSDALSPDQLTNHDSPLSVLPPTSPSEGRSQSGDLSPTQFLTQPPPPPPPPPPPLPLSGSESPLSRVCSGTAVTSPTSRSSSTHIKLSQTKSGVDRPPQRSKKAKDNKPKVKKLKYHQYIPPDQKADRERPPQMDSSYAKLLQQQQLFLQLQILSQQQQHYNYHTILPAPPKPPNEQPPASSSGPSPSRSVATTTTASSTNQSPVVRPTQTTAGGAKPGALPSNLDEFKVAELKAELKLRGLTVSGTKNDLIERLRNYQEQNASMKNNIPPASSPDPHLQQQPGEGSGLKITLTPLKPTQEVQPHQIMRFGSTSSSPPVSPSPSERSLAGMSPDETSCSGDMFGEMVSSPLTQLSLHPSPQQPSLCPVKDESPAPSCVLAKLPEAAVTMETSSMDKDQMLQEKDKQIEELTRMLRQKQQLVETLRSQLEQGKMAVKEEDASKTQCVQVQVKPTNLIKASAIQPPTLPNGVVLKLKKEEPEEKMEEEGQVKKATQPMQCSQETLLRLQQIHRLQVQQAEQHKQQQQAPKAPQQQQRKDAQILLRQQQQIQQLIIQQTQQKAQGKLVQQIKQVPVQQQKNQVKQVQVQIHNQTTANQRAALNQATANQRAALNQATANQRAALSQTTANQRIALSQATANQREALSQTTANQRAAQSQQKKQKVHQRQQQKQTTPASTQQVASVVINQQNGTQIHTQAISLDLLKTNGAPTLVTDSNGNHYLIALTTHQGDGHNGLNTLTKTNGRITLQRLQSSPSKLPSSESESKEQPSVELTSQQPLKKTQKAGLHLDVSRTAQPSVALTAPPSLQPFFDDITDSESHNIMSSLKENGVNTQQMDDLFDILLKSGEIPGFRSNPDPSLAPLHSDPPSPPSPSSLHLSPVHSEPLPCPPRPGTEGSGRLEDFLESTTGVPLIGVEGAGLTLIDDLHSQMLSTPSILEQPPSPMDTSELGLGFGEPGPLDSMDWLDISMGGGMGESGGGDRDGGTGAPLAQSVFSADFLDSSDLQLHWESCL